MGNDISNDHYTGLWISHKKSMKIGRIQCLNASKTAFIVHIFSETEDDEIIEAKFTEVVFEANQFDRIDTPMGVFKISKN